MPSHKAASAETFMIEPLNPEYHGKPIWVIYGPSRFWPQILCCKLNAYSSTHALLPAGRRGATVCIWGYSLWRGKPGFRTLGVDVEEWGARQEWGPFFYDVQAYALDHLREITTPRSNA